MENCIFCKIIKGEIPSTKIYEDENFLAFMEINPVTKGHTLLIPKEHHETIYDLPQELAKKFIPTVQKVAKAQKEALQARKIALAVWGEDVSHAHMHLIPRYEHDGVQFFKQNKADMAELVIQAEKIINKLD